MNRLPLLLTLPLVLASLVGTGAVQDQWVPGEVIIVIREESLGDLNWGGLQRGELSTGLASLDSLIQRTGVLSIVELAPYTGDHRYYLLQFPSTISVPDMVALYQANEHIAIAEPNDINRTAVAPTSWAAMKALGLALDPGPVPGVRASPMCGQVRCYGSPGLAE